MFGNMSESVNIGNDISAKNNQSNKFSGGFKQPSILKNNKITLKEKDNNQDQQNKIDVYTVYDEFGLINDSIGNRNSTSKGKPKYREDAEQQSSSLGLSNPFKLQ